jgi:hypothetical protein
LTATLRRLARRIGVALTVLAVVLVLWRLGSLWQQTAPLMVDSRVAYAVIVLSMLYALSLFLLATVWSMLAIAGETLRPGRLASLVHAYGVSSIAKYLPGNVFHLAGRQIYGARLGVPHASMAMASVLETALCVIAALLVALAFLAFGDAEGGFMVDSRLVWIGVAVSVLVLLAALSAGMDGPVRRVLDSADLAAPGVSRLALAAVLCCVFFAVSGGIALGADYAIAEGRRMSVVVGSAYVLAWLTGFLVPGASGGLGVREGALLLLLAPQIGEPTALALALSTRLITTLGDVLFAGSCRLLGPESIGHWDDR